jgi:hypothetical protein
VPSWNASTIRSRPSLVTPPWRNGASKWNWSLTCGAQQLAHLAELGEHQGAFVGVEEFGDELVEAGELAGAPGEA